MLSVDALLIGGLLIIVSEQNVLRDGPVLERICMIDGFCPSLVSCTRQPAGSAENGDALYLMIDENLAIVKVLNTSRPVQNI